MKDFYQGKTIVITGASSGIGYDFAEYLAPFRVKLALVARRETQLEELAQKCEKAGSEAIVVAADVSSRESMESLRDKVLDKWGFADIIIGNAGVGGLNPAVSFDLDIHRRTMEINVMGLAYTLVPFIPSMIEQKKGHLVGVSSLAAFRGLPKAGSYSPSKAAQGIFLESLRVDLRPYGISVSSIHPGFVTTPMTDHEDFTMPFKISARESSVLIAKALKKKKAVYLYPWQMRVLTYVNRRIPNWLFDRIMPRMSGQKKDIIPKML